MVVAAFVSNAEANLDRCLTQAPLQRPVCLRWTIATAALVHIRDGEFHLRAMRNPV
jgi:hypothetical protein